MRVTRTERGCGLIIMALGIIVFSIDIDPVFAVATALIVSGAVLAAR